MRASRAALGRGFDVNLRVPSKQNEAIRWRLNVRAECRAGEILAISAVTNRNHSGIDVRLKRDLAAVTTAIDLHGAFLLSPTIGSRPLDTRAFFFRPVAGNFDAQAGIWIIDQGLRQRGAYFSEATFSYPKSATSLGTKTGAGQDARPRLAPFRAD
jgi:hypothetical protein